MIEYLALKETIIDKNVISEGEGVFLQAMTSDYTSVIRYDGTIVIMPTVLFSERFQMHRLQM